VWCEEHQRVNSQWRDMYAATGVTAMATHRCRYASTKKTTPETIATTARATPPHRAARMRSRPRYTCDLSSWTSESVALANRSPNATGMKVVLTPAKNVT